VFASNALEVLALGAGNPLAPVNAIPGRAIAYMQLRFVQGCAPEAIVPSVQRHLDARGFSDLTVRASRAETMAATALDIEHPFVAEVLASIERTTAKKPVLLPGLGGSLPNECFAVVLGLPTVWVPHSYPGCNQHAPGEHMIAAVARESLAIMTGLLWDLGAPER
jgi:acetylornithine deacetylase/succinyl-diaminopimelate desuccinylase-like protein